MDRDPRPPRADPEHTDELLELGDAFFELDRDWRIVRVNRRQEELSRRPRSETVGRTFAEVWPDLATPGSRYWREYDRCMRERVSVQFQAYYAPLDLWTGVTAYPVSTGGIAVFFRDITAIKRAEGAQVRLAAIVESSDDAIISKDLEGIVRTWNPGAERLFGYAADEIVGRPITLLLPADRPGEEDRILAELRAGHRVDHFATRRLRKDGTVVDVSVSVSPLRDAAGELVGASKIARDITEQARAVEALRASEQHLRAAHERLRDADRRKDEFLGMLSHELRNPLAPIRNAIYILDHAEPTGQQARRAREVVNRQVAHLTRLVDDLLDVTRIARGKIELRRAKVDLVALARGTAEDYRPLMHERGVELAVAAPDEALVVDGDETRLAQILGNLLSNAAKFTAVGGRVTLAVGRGGDRAVVRVRDTGVGIPPDLLPTIFDAFTQGEQTIERSEGGLGLGLALVKGLTELHGGRVSAASGGAGAGTELTVELPLVEPVEAAAPPRLRAAARRTYRVLVVDDNVDAAESLAELVRLFGHVVEVAHDGPSALAKVQAERPDVVLCDLGLPGMDGYEVARALRAQLDGGVQLVAVSGYAQPEDVRRSAEAGFDDHVAKPPDPERIERLFS